jgi:hypothetical protein
LRRETLFVGLTNYLPKVDKYLLFVDLDGVSDRYARAQLKRSGDALLVKTRENHFWILGLNPLARADWLENYFLSADDWRHFGFTKRWGRTVIRLSRKRLGDSLTLVCLNRSPSPFKPVSRYHVDFLAEILQKPLTFFDFNPRVDGGIEFTKYYAEGGKRGGFRG